MNYPPPPPPMNAPGYGAPPNAPSYGAPPYGAPPRPQPFAPMPFYGAPFPQEPGVWQDGLALITSKAIILPDRCVKCNAPANGYRLKRNLSWHDPLFYLIVLASPLIYVIVAMIVRKRARVDIGLCESHKQNRSIALFVAWFLFLAGVAAIVLAFASESGMIGLVGILLVIAAAIYGSLGPRMIYASKIDERFAWIKGVNREYLSQFPQWPRY